jgi:S1-C subfamily serine protease
MARTATTLAAGALLLASGCVERPPGSAGAQTSAAAATAAEQLLSPPVRELSGEQVAAAVMASVVVLTLEDERGQPTALGTGFVVGPGLVVTNHHVIRGAAGGTARPIGSTQAHTIRGTRFIDVERDLALLDVSLDLPGLALAPDLPPLLLGGCRGCCGSLRAGTSGRAFNAA